MGIKMAMTREESGEAIKIAVEMGYAPVKLCSYEDLEKEYFGVTIDYFGTPKTMWDIEKVRELPKRNTFQLEMNGLISISSMTDLMKIEGTFTEEDKAKIDSAIKISLRYFSARSCGIEVYWHEVVKNPEFFPETTHDYTYKVIQNARLKISEIRKNAPNVYNIFER